MCGTYYRQLCELVGFLDSFLSMKTIPCSLPNECSKTLVLKSEDEVFMSGEAILWKDFGNALRRSEPEYVYKVLVDACRGRGYKPTYIEDAYDSFMPEDHENRKGPSASRIFESDSTPQKEADSRETMHILETETEGPQTFDTNQDHGPRDDRFSISGIEDSKHGVLRCLIGPYNVYVVHREAGDGTEMARIIHRYRVYIPALCMGQFIAPGFSSWSDIPASPNEIQIRNTAYSSGHSREYFKKVWFPHVSLCSPLLLGGAPLSHNTPVEVSFQRTKHHSELGVEAMQRPGGMPISEYVKKAAEFSMSNALRVSHNLIKKRNSNGSLKHPQILKNRKKSLAELTRETNPSVSNARILDGVFVGKKTGQSPEGGLGDGQSAHPVPATQQSQTEAANEEERWVKRRGIHTREDEQFFETMITAKETYFGE